MKSSIRRATKMRVEDLEINGAIEGSGKAAVVPEQSSKFKTLEKSLILACFLCPFDIPNYATEKFYSAEI